MPAAAQCIPLSAAAANDAGEEAELQCSEISVHPLLQDAMQLKIVCV